MKREQLSEIISNVDERHIAEAACFDPAFRVRSPERIGTMKTKRIITLALAAALVLALGVGAFATVYNRRVQDLVMRDSAPDGLTIVDDGGSDIVVVGEEAETSAEEPSKSYDPLPGDTDMISLQGFAGSPEYQAAQAWAEFCHNYDRDGAVLAQTDDDPTPWMEYYANGYMAYSQEMADRINEIAAEFGLSLHSGGIHSVDSMADMYARFGKFSSTTNWNGYYFDDGTFQCDCSADGIDYQIRRCMKGVLDTVSLNIADAGQYEQWEYTTACGETVLLALGPVKALILAESEQSFTVVNVMAGTEADFAADALEALADDIDFSLL